MLGGKSCDLLLETLLKVLSVQKRYDFGENGGWAVGIPEDNLRKYIILYSPYDQIQLHLHNGVHRSGKATWQPPLDFSV